MAINTAKLPDYALRRLISAGMNTTTIAQLSFREAMDAWLRYEGIIGFTEDIIDMYVALHEASQP